MPLPDRWPRPDKRRPPPFRAAARAAADAKWTGTLPDKYAATLTELVSQQNVEGWVAELCAFHTRHSLSAFVEDAADWIVARFQGFGYAGVQKVPFTVGGVQRHNVVCEKPAAAGGAAGVVVVCGHYDCRMEDPDDATARAPGADDNASGIAAILEMARILADVELARPVRFAAFAGEEQGLVGSSAYVQHLQAAGVAVHRVVNLDMVGHPPADGTVTVEEDQGNAVAANDAASHLLADLMEQMGADYTGLATKRGPVYSSDYMPFEAAGHVVAGVFDDEDNPHYHHASDTPDTLDYAYLADVTRLVLATLLAETLAWTDEASSPVDLYIRDSPADTGAQPSPTPHWTSPDLWVRNAPPPGDDPEEGHQPPINDVPNYLYVRVHNRGAQDAPANGFAVEAFRCDPGTGMIFPDHFQPLGSLAIVEPVPAGGSVRVGPFVWTPHIVGHECLLAVASGPGDHAVPDAYSGPLNHALLVRYDNNVGQRNVEPQGSVPGGKTKTAFLVRGGMAATSNRLTLDASALPADTRIGVRTLRRIVDPSTLEGLAVSAAGTVWTALEMHGGSVAAIGPFPLAARDEVAVELTIDFSVHAEHLQVYPLVATQEQGGALAGRMTIEITAVKEAEDWVFGNRRSRELHRVTCPFWTRILPRNRVPFPTVDAAVARGYNGCAVCLAEHDTG